MNARFERFSRRERSTEHSFSSAIDEGGLLVDTVFQVNPRDFVLKRLIGAGGVCKVYEASHRSSGRSVCIKILKRQFRHQSRFIRRFRDEYRLTSKLSYPNIVRTHGLGRLPDGGYFLVLDLVAGTNLHLYLHSKTVSAIETARIVAQVADCVAHSHQHGIVHCDLKPANVLIDDRGDLWLTDFGFARTAFRERANGGFSLHAGTAAYLAPEQFATELGKLDGTDIHGLGAILFESLTGSPPYAKRTMEALEIGKPDEPINFALIKGAPLLLVEICHRCLDRSPEKRLEDANCVANALRDLGGH